jgi:hypothetical protein
MVGLLASAIARSETPPIVGHVLDLNGDWYVYMSAAGDAEGKPLSKWQELPAQAVVRIKSPSVYDYIRIVDQHLTIIIEKSCRDISKCFQPIYLPQAAHEQQGNDILAAALQQVWNLLAGEEYERSMHRVRDMVPTFFEAVAPLRDGGLDLAEALHGIRGGRYLLGPCEEEVNCEATRDRSSFVEFDWKPETATTPVQIGKSPSGLYEVASLEPTPRQGLALSFRILGCTSESYPSVRAAFASVQTLTREWQESPETTHSFLRAYLAQLARSRVCTS